MALYMSPHIDDVVFSCGGHIIDQHKDAVIANIFTQEVHDTKSLFNSDLSLKQRRQEEKGLIDIFKRIKGAKYNLDLLYLDFPEALNRGYKIENVLGPHNGDILTHMDKNLIMKIEDIIKTQKADEVYFPSGTGNHVDHVLLFLIGIKLKKKLKHINIFFYEEFPYNYARDCHGIYNILNLMNPVNYFTREFRFYLTMAYSKYMLKSGKKRNKIILPRLTNVKEIDISGNINAKIELCRIYGNQIEVLFGKEKLLSHSLKKYAVERYFFDAELPD